MMGIGKYDSMAYKNADDLLFGNALYPVKTGLGLEIGSGYTTAEINYAPRPQAGESKSALVDEYERITRDVMQRMVQVGFQSVVLETEHVQQMTKNPSWGAEVAEAQKAIMETYHDEYGIKCALRHTIADIRGDSHGVDLRGDLYNLLMESFELVASSGADMLSIESLGGKEVFDHSILRNDFRGLLFSVGILGTLDVGYLWDDICKIAKKQGVIPAGDSACSQANTAMFIAGGMLDKKLSHSVAAVVRGMSASRTLAAYESGAEGPGKDCGYENTIIKAITGTPISQEGKSSTCAHSDFMGNLVMQCCDLWSNESVEYHGDFGGTTVQCWGETLAYDCTMMNTALVAGCGKMLRDVLMASDRYRDPQSFILAYDNAYRIGEAIVGHPDDIYLRSYDSSLVCCDLIEEASLGFLHLSKFEKATIKKTRAELKALTMEQESFIDSCLDVYKEEVGSFDPSNYDL
jgi:methanol--5-hydroxybenzimidazolylcobamide Co-methyltransferase